MAELVKAEQKMTTLRDFWEKNKGKVTAVLPKHFSPDRQGQLLFTMVYTNPDLLDCTPASLVGAVMRGGMLGLEPVGPGGYWLAPFWERKRDRRNVTMIVDYRGLMGMARRTKEVKVVDWREVRVGDKLEYEYGSQGFLRHVPSPDPIHRDGKEREITHCYAYGILTSGAMVFEVMRKEDIEWHRDRYSKAAGAGPWVTAFSEMGAKTCVRKLADKLPFDPLLSRAVEIDMKTEIGVGEDFSALLGEIGDSPGGNGGKLDRLREELEKDVSRTGRDESGPLGGKEADVSEREGPRAPDQEARKVDPGRPAQGRAVTSDAPPAAAEGEPPPKATPAGRAQQKPKGAPAAAGPGGVSMTPEAATQAIPGTQRTKTVSALVDRVNTLYDDLDLTEPKKRSQREWLWGRFVGAGVKVEDAPPEKVQALIAELEKLVANKKKNGKK